MTVLPDVRIGDFTFVYDESRSELHVVHGQEHAAMVGVVSREEWEKFRFDATLMFDDEAITVQLESAQMQTAESQQDGWEVSLAGPWGDVTWGWWASHVRANAEALAVHESLRIALGERAVKLERP